MIAEALSALSGMSGGSDSGSNDSAAAPIYQTGGNITFGSKPGTIAALPDWVIPAVLLVGAFLLFRRGK